MVFLIVGAEVFSFGSMENVNSKKLARVNTARVFMCFNGDERSRRPNSDGPVRLTFLLSFVSQHLHHGGNLFVCTH